MSPRVQIGFGLGAVAAIMLTAFPLGGLAAGVVGLGMICHGARREDRRIGRRPALFAAPCVFLQHLHLGGALTWRRGPGRVPPFELAPALEYSKSECRSRRRRCAHAVNLRSGTG